jgi:hypothetical protein
MLAPTTPSGCAVEASGIACDLSADELAAFLSEIPTETTPAERLLLWNLFQHDWDGEGQVIEIGPFLGGTTRAIAAGMLRNPRLSTAARLHTFDRFGEYYEPQALRRMVDPVVQRGALPAEEADRLCAAGDFLQIFHAIHRPHSYHRLIQACSAPLPDRPEELGTVHPFARFADDTALGALFVDGCKSWVSTHYAMKFLLPRLRLGAPVVFQDFGWYTCFWISSAVHALRDLLEFQTHVDATYVYRLRERVSEGEIARRFATTPAAMGPVFFKQAADALMNRSRERGDLRGELISILHHVAALLTIGRRPEAATILKSLDVRRYAAFADMMRGCLNSPTYLPGGKPLRWNQA